MQILVDDKGFTRPDPDPPNASNPPNATPAPNAQVYLESNSDAFFRFLLPRLCSP
jgi:hypothetical protein